MLSDKAKAFMGNEPALLEEIVEYFTDMTVEQVAGLKKVTQMHSECAVLLAERTKKLCELPVQHPDNSIGLEASGVHVALESQIRQNVETLCRMGIDILIQTREAHRTEDKRDA